MTVLFNRCLKEKKIPQEWNNANTILLYKKGDRTDLKNYRPISLLSHLYKLFTKILTNRLKTKLEKVEDGEQAGFKTGFSTIEQQPRPVSTLLKGLIRWHNSIHHNPKGYEKNRMFNS